MSPKLKTSTRGSWIGKDTDEQTRAEASGSDGASQEWGVEAGRCGLAAESELPTGKEGMGTIPSGGSQGVETPQRRSGIETQEAEEIQGEGAANYSPEVLGGSGGTVRTNAGGGALGERGSAGDSPGDPTAVDVGGRV